jgi:hypothetical protein
MEASILVLVIGSFACWCVWRCFKLQEKSELKKQKDNDAGREDMPRRFKGEELPGDWTKSMKPTVGPTARNQASPQKSSAGTSTIRSGSSTVRP